MELLKDQPRQELGLTPHSSPPSSKAGDTVGVVRREDGTLHFFVNGMTQGPAAWNVPPGVYAVVDLYGQAAQATIVDDVGEGRAGQGLGWPWEASEMIVGLKGDVHLQRCPKSLNHSLRGTTRCLQAPHRLGLGARTSASTSCMAAMRSSPTGAVLRSATIAAASSTMPLSSPTGQCLDFYVPTSLLLSISHPSGACLTAILLAEP